MISCLLQKLQVWFHSDQQEQTPPSNMPTPIPGFLLPRGPPSALMLRALQRQNARSFSSTSAALKKAKSTTPKPRVLEKPDRFRPPSHPQRLVTPSPKGAPPNQPFEYGPRTTEKERVEQSQTQYPGMFPPEGTVMHRFLTSKWIHIWISMVSYSHLYQVPELVTNDTNRASSWPVQASHSQQTSKQLLHSHTSFHHGLVS